MDLYHNVLSGDILDKCTIELNSLLHEPVWKVSDQFWDRSIQVGVTGVCTSTLVKEPLRQQIHGAIQSLLPEHKNLMIQHYIWHKHGAISLHDDSGHKFGATIYLNKNWNIDNGGIFVWKNNLTHELHAHCPEYNSLMLNSKCELHLVTPISPLTSENRITLQIWGS